MNILTDTVYLPELKFGEDIIDNSPRDYSISFLKDGTQRFLIKRTEFCGQEINFYITYENFSYILDQCDISKGIVNNCVIIFNTDFIQKQKTLILVPVCSPIFSEISQRQIIEKKRIVLKEGGIYKLRTNSYENIDSSYLYCGKVKFMEIIGTSQSIRNILAHKSFHFKENMLGTYLSYFLSSNYCRFFNEEGSYLFVDIVTNKFVIFYERSEVYLTEYIGQSDKDIFKYYNEKALENKEEIKNYLKENFHYYSYMEYLNSYFLLLNASDKDYFDITPEKELAIRNISADIRKK